MRYVTVFALGAALIATQSRVNGSSAQTNTSGSGKRQHVATLHSSDSPEGSRVVLSSDQLLNDYEAYRRGDRFYVKIPAADMPGAEALRGRGFADVKAQRSGDNTVVSFRLEPGTTAHVEQHVNRLYIVFSVPGGHPSVAENSSREVPQPVTFPESNRNANADKRVTSAAATNKNVADRANTANARSAQPSTASNSNNSNAARNNAPAAAALNPAAKPAATPIASPLPSPAARLPTPTPAQKSMPAIAQSSLNQPPSSPTSQPRQDSWSQMKARANYWILLAQLNPIPVATGVGLLILLLGLLLLQRRRAKSTGRVQPGKKSSKAATINDATASVQAAAESESAPVIAPVVSATAPLVAAAPRREEARHEGEAGPPVPVAEASPTPLNAPHRERVTRVAEEAKKLMTGGSYDDSIIGSDDRETRQLVGAELLSAIVGRNVLRREFAREAFLKHGYFDDATRDLRIAESEHERVAAARRLSFVHDREATPHLIGALGDPAPDVRRAAVEALMDLRDPAAIAPLNALMQTENDRKVPRTLIKHAIDACATVALDEGPPAAAPDYSSATIPEPSSQPIETEREVIEL